MQTRPLPHSLTLSTALVATAACLVIGLTQTAEATPAPSAGIPASPSAVALRQLAAEVQGSYTLSDGRTLVVAREAGELRATLDGEAPMSLLPDRASTPGATRLRSTDGTTAMEFVTGSDGRAWRVTLTLRR